MSLRIRSRLLLCYPLLLAILCGPSLSALAARPTAPRLLPQTTLLYVRVNNVIELIDRFQETSIGQIAATFPFTEITGFWAYCNLAAAALIAAFAV